MKILHVYKDFDPPVHGGMERHIALMCRFQRQWADVEALSCSRTPFTRRVERDGTPVTEVGEWGRFQSAPVSPMYPFYLKRMKADVVVVHVPNPTAVVSYLVSRPSGRLVVRYHSDIVRQAAALKLYRPVLTRLLRRADAILPTSQPYVDTSPILKPVQDRCRVVPLGILPEDFAAPPQARIEAIKNEYGGPFVFFCGRHRYYKGLEYLVRAAERINARVVIAGEGPETPRLRLLARSMNIKVAFPGRLDQEALNAHLHACELVAFPSVERSEAFGISILEAHACGKPVVATRLGTGVELANLHGETGLNVAVRDCDALAEGINELLGDEALRSRLGARAKERVTQDFDARAVARQEFDIFQEVLECSKTGT